MIIPNCVERAVSVGERIASDDAPAPSGASALARPKSRTLTAPRLRFARETREPVGVRRKQLRQHLDGDVAIQSGIAGAKDFPMPPLPMAATIW